MDLGDGWGVGGWRGLRRVILTTAVNHKQLSRVPGHESGELIYVQESFQLGSVLT